jgi:hypothetical protein
MALTLGGCGDPEAESHETPEPNTMGPVDLTVPDAWFSAGSDHPWGSVPNPCDADYIVEVYDERSVAEIDTSLCRNQTLSQPLQFDLEMGTSVLITGFHFGLSRSESTQGLFGIAIGDQILLEEVVDIPGTSGGFQRRVSLERFIKSGELIFWHIHNHGSNRWILIDLRVDSSQPAN